MSPASLRPPAVGPWHRQVAAITAARRVLVTGLVGASVESVQAACTLAEALGAAVDFGQPDLDRPAGPSLARCGAVTADPGEMRDRADLVILWNCDPALVGPTIAAFVPPRARVLQLPPSGADPVAVARLVHQLLRGGEPPASAGAWMAECVAAREAISAAACVAIVTDDTRDPVGLESWSITHLVREIAHRKPAFEIPLRADDLATAAAVCTWRYGAAGAVARADRFGSRFLPAESSATRLIARREVDCVVAVGRLAAAVEEALADDADMAVVRVAAEPRPLGELLADLRGSPAGGHG